MITTPRVDALIELEVVRELKADALPSEADWFRREDDNPDEYYHGVTHTAWRAWQESRRIAFAECESDARAMMIMADEAAARIRKLGETR